MASNGMKFIYLKKQQNTPTKVFIFLILIMFLLEHAKKTARTVRKKKKPLEDSKLLYKNTVKENKSRFHELPSIFHKVF